MMIYRKQIALAIVASMMTACGGGSGTGTGTGTGNTMVRPDDDRGKVFTPIPVDNAELSPIIGHESQWHIGANIAPSEPMRATMNDIGTRSSVSTRHGRLADRASAAELAGFLSTLEEADDSITRQEGALTVLLSTDADAATEEYATRAIRIVNAALPHEFRLTLGTERVQDDGTFSSEDVAAGTLVIVEREQPGGFSGLGGTNTVRPSYDEWLEGRPNTHDNLEAYISLLSRGERNAGYVEIDPKILQPRRERGVDGTADWEEANAIGAFVHELIHAIGFGGHPDRTRFTQSVMSYSRTRDNPHIVYPIDYDALLAMYTLINPKTTRTEQPDGRIHISGASHTEEDLLEALGEWDDSSMHIVGEFRLGSEAVTFGARASNGLAQAWATGPRPYLLGRQTLQGTATWEGAMLGMTPTERAVIGNADLGIDFTTVTGTLSFSGLEQWEPRATPGMAGTGTQWGDGDLAYEVNVESGTFSQTGGDEGTVTGSFFGANYNAMGGVLKRDDLSAGFGGRRQ